MKPSTVAEVIAKLQTLPQDLPCYIRPKYTGDISYYDDVAVNINGIAEMHPDPKVYPDKCKNVTFLI